MRERRSTPHWRGLVPWLADLLARHPEGLTTDEILVAAKSVGIDPMAVVALARNTDPTCVGETPDGRGLWALPFNRTAITRPTRQETDQ